MTSKYIPPPMKNNVSSIPNVPKVSENIKSSVVMKWLPFICAGAAVGVSILALKELTKIKSEMILLKNQQTNVVKTDPTLNLKMDQLEEQLKKINEYLMNNNPKNPKIIKNVISDLPKEVTIINESEDNGNNGNNGDEYEEIEVTDDEEDEQDN